jgi:predicted AAA+ superfamily ATPase
MASGYGLVERRVSELLARLVTEEPVIALHGPRSVGKSTVLWKLADANQVGVIDLDDVETREALTGNPRLVTAGATPLCIDEYQRVPEILDAIKARLNRDGTRPGLAVITGSTRQDALPRTAQALTGRLHSLTIWPLSQGELAGVQEDLLASLRSDAAETVAQQQLSEETRDGYAERVCAGGLPLAMGRSETARARWFDDYVRQSVDRDALELSQVRQRQALAELLTYLATQGGQLINVTKAADAVGVDRKTGESYLRLLEDLFLVARLPAWGTELRSRVSARAKVHLVDSGLAARLLRLTPAKLAGLDASAMTGFGRLLETFVVGEIRKQASWLDEPVTLGHWRTSDGAEVDLVVEFDDGEVVAFEVAANERATAPVFNGLAQLRDALGSRFRAGVVLTTGTRSYTYADRLHAMPIDRLWQVCSYPAASRTRLVNPATWTTMPHS